MPNFKLNIPLHPSHFIGLLISFLFVASASLADTLRLEFGALTRAGFGAVEVGNIETLPPELSAHWAIQNGKITPSEAGDSADLAEGLYAGRLADGRQVEISVVPASYSVASMDELKRGIFNPNLKYGERILLRGGNYTVKSVKDGQTGRKAPPVGDPVKDGPVIVEPHDGAKPVIQHLRIGGNVSHFAFRGLTFRTRLVPGGENLGSVQIIAPLPGLRFEGNTFSYGKKVDGTEGDIVMGIYSPGPIRVDRLRVVGNLFDGVVSAMGPFTGDGILIDRNTIRRAGGDDILINKGRGISITNNLMTDRVFIATPYRIMSMQSDGAGGTLIETDRALPSGRALENVLISREARIDPIARNRAFHYLRDFNRDTDVRGNTIRIRSLDYRRLKGGYQGGGRLLATGVHGDAIQIFPTKYKDGDLDGMTITGNVILLGDGSVGFNSRQGGIWVDSGTAKKKKRDWTIIGNLIEHSGRNGIVVRNLINARVWSNTVVRRVGFPNVAGISQTFIVVGGSGSFHDNVANRFDLSGWRGQAQGNVEIPEVSPRAYQARFRDPPVRSTLWDAENYDWQAYLPGSGMPAQAGIGGWDHGSRTYRGPR